LFGGKNQLLWWVGSPGKRKKKSAWKTKGMFIKAVSFDESAYSPAAFNQVKKKGKKRPGLQGKKKEKREKGPAGKKEARDSYGSRRFRPRA